MANNGIEGDGKKPPRLMPGVRQQSCEIVMTNKRGQVSTFDKQGEVGDVDDIWTFLVKLGTALTKLTSK